MKFLLSLCLIVSLFGCSEYRANKKNTNFFYGQLVFINKGFFRGYNCVVLQDYPKDNQLYCQLLSIKYSDGTDHEIKEEYRDHFNIDYSDVEVIK